MILVSNHHLLGIVALLTKAARTLTEVCRHVV
jgi:hypothetical protein